MKRAGAVAVVVLGIAAAGCGGPGGSRSSLAVKTGRFRLDEWSITADRSALRAGRQTITAAYIGPHTHELVVVAARDAASLPTKSDGSVDETRLDAVKVGEIADVAAATSRARTFGLAAGSYVVFCNLVDNMGHGNGMGGMGGMGDGMQHVHFVLGMHTGLTVTA